MKSGIVSSTQITQENLWLSGSFHLSDAEIFKRQIRKKAHKVLGDLLEVPPFYGSRRKRIYVDNPKKGLPYLSNTNIMSLSPLKRCKYISKLLSNNIESDVLKKGMTLISRVGTIGQVSYVRMSLSGAVGSDNIFRLIPSNEIFPGYLYAFMSSVVGVELQKQLASGGVQDYIDGNNLSKIPIPRLGSALEKKIHDLIEKAAKMRDEATLILHQAQESICLELFGINFQELLSGTNKNNSINYKIINSASLLSNNLRLDASYHASVGEHILRLLFNNNILGKSENDFIRIRDICIKDGLFIGGRAKRNYVESPKYGLPFLSSREMLYASFKNVKLISKKQPNIEDLILRQGWTLISRSGTIGNTAYVRKDMDGLTGSEHIMRVVPDLEKISPGYLYSYLSSDIGYYLITRGTFGSVVDTITPDYVASLPIPRLGYPRENKIHQLVEHAAEFQTDANDLENHAQELLIDSLNIY